MANYDLDKATSTLMDASQREHKFTQKVNINGFNKTGTFIATIPTIAQRIQIGVLRAKMLDGAPAISVDRFTDDLAFMVAYLQVTIRKFPQWWNWDEVDDVDAIRSMFTEVTDWVNSFRRDAGNNSNATDSSSSADEEDMEGDEGI